MRSARRSMCVLLPEPTELLTYTQPLKRDFDLDPALAQIVQQKFAIAHTCEHDDVLGLRQQVPYLLAHVVGPRTSLADAHSIQRLLVRIDHLVWGNEAIF